MRLLTLLILLGFLACALCIQPITNDNALVQVGTEGGPGGPPPEGPPSDVVEENCVATNDKTTCQSQGKSWTRIHHCTGTDLGGWDLPVDTIKQLANIASQIRIYKEDGRFVQSLPNTFPIENLRKGETLSFINLQGKSTKEVVAATWVGDADLLEHLWNSCGSGNDMFNGGRVYWGCNNAGGFHIEPANAALRQTGVCQWVWNLQTTKSKISIWIDPVPTTTAAPNNYDNNYNNYNNYNNDNNYNNYNNYNYDTPAPEIDACQHNPCGANANCVDKPNPALDNADGRICTCKAGYEGNPSTGCTDADACQSNPCGSNANCVDKAAPAPNTAEGRICTCQDGFAGNPQTGCADADACQSNPCGSNANCVDKAAPAPNTAEGRICTCKDGFAGNPQTGCADADACQSTPCGANTNCVDKAAPAPNTAEGRICTCQDGFAGNPETGCTDCNACINFPCGMNANCVDKAAPAPNTAEGRICTCRDGYQGNPQTGCTVVEPSGWWRLVFRQTYQTVSAFKPGVWNLNEDDPTALNFAILDKLDNYRLTGGANKGAFRFKLAWPHTTGNDWIQKSNPTTDRTVDGYVGVNVTQTDNTWGGLRLHGGQACLLDGSTQAGLWYYAIGSFGGWGSPVGIPSNKLPTQVVELFVYDTKTPVEKKPDYSLGPKVWNGRYRLVARQTIPYFYSNNQLSLNPDDATNFNFATLDQLDKYRLRSGKTKGDFQFKLVASNIEQDNEWTQTSNPVNDQTVVGYRPVDIWYEENFWGGLHRDGKYALLSGSTNFPSYWWYAVGSFHPWGPGQIPVFSNQASHVVQLYVLDDSDNNNQEQGDWHLVFRQTFTAPSAWKADTWRLNADDSTAWNFAILDELENYRLKKGPFKGNLKLKISWPHTDPNVWVQKSNPTNTTSVDGYVPISVAHNEYFWGGLNKDTSGHALLEGSINHPYWYYAIGSFNIWGTGIPSNTLATQSVELHVWDESPSWDASKQYVGPQVLRGTYHLLFRQTLPYLYQKDQFQLNTEDATHFNYARLVAETINKYRLTKGPNKGDLQFRLSWPGQPAQDWIQTSNPVSAAADGTNPQPGLFPVNLPDGQVPNNWGGLHVDNKYALLSGSLAWPNAWWYAVGSFQLWGGGIPDISGPEVPQAVALYVLDGTEREYENGFYRLVCRQTTMSGLPYAFKPNTLRLNPEDPTNFNYAVLDTIDNYRLRSGPAKGKFRFKIQWPQTSSASMSLGNANEWVQSSNPVNVDSVSGYEPISVPHNENVFGGLMKNGVWAVLEGSLDWRWYYAVGSFATWGSGGIPGPVDAVQQVELYVWDDTGVNPPDFLAGPTTENGQYMLLTRQVMPFLFAKDGWNLNVKDGTKFNYANLKGGLLGDSKDSLGNFRFLLTWPGKEPQEWCQTSNPVNSANVTGYRAIKVPHTQQGWAGLHVDQQYALLSGTNAWPASWWYAVGSFIPYQGGIPSFDTAVVSVQLYVHQPAPGKDNGCQAYRF